LHTKLTEIEIHDFYLSLTHYNHFFDDPCFRSALVGLAVRLACNSYSSCLSFALFYDDASA